MESRVGYTIVGGFLLLLIAITTYFTVWYKGSEDKKAYKYYKINVQESVAGLEVGAVVKYMGVTVGKVTNIFIDPKNPQEVTIIIAVDENTPVKTDSYAQLSAQGITGLLFVDIHAGSSEFSILDTTKEANIDEMGEIKMKPTFFSNLDENLNKLINHFDKTLQAVQNLLLKSEKIFSKENTKNIENTLKEISIAAENASTLIINLKETEKKFANFLDTGSKSMKSFDNLSKAAHDIIKIDASIAIQNINDASVKLQHLIETLNEKAEKSDFDLKDILEPTARQLSNSMKELEIFIRQLQENPSDLFFKQTEQKLGPGESK
jgi:phospholipid/cholesterol/gamma-HCH transport system substrate-binding protein